jgi:DNA-binding NtrC family response regulator
MSSRLSLLVDLASRLGREVGFDALLGVAGERLAAALSCERATIWLIDAASNELVTRVAVLPEVPALRQPLDRGIAGYVARTGECVRIDEAAKDPRFDPSADRVTGFTTRSMLVVPLREDERAPIRGVVQLLNRFDGAFDEADLPYLEALAAQLARALDLTTLRSEDAAVPGVTLRGPFNRIIGRSPELAHVYEQIALAAETDASVLLRGETGTGKGIFARAIHVNSSRQEGPFVTVDCTTLPGQLVESELFGHERGAFTGADRRVPGRVELAQHGTLFLDEVGDLPLDVQGKLLRFLQERTFDRVGGRTTLEADVRVIAATHRDLEAAVLAGTFREDLYYRLCVVEIRLPALRERKGDIPLLAQNFLREFSKELGKDVKDFTADALETLINYPWPGNVRELRSALERAVVLCRGDRVTVRDLPGTVRSEGLSAPEKMLAQTDLTVEEAEKQLIIRALKESGGNRTAAAQKIGMSRRTLHRKLHEYHLEAM